MEPVGSHHSWHSYKGQIDKLLYLTPCASTLHQFPLCIQYAKIFAKTKFSNFHFVRYPVALSWSSVNTLFFVFPGGIFRKIWAWRCINPLWRWGRVRQRLITGVVSVACMFNLRLGRMQIGRELSRSNRVARWHSQR